MEKLFFIGITIVTFLTMEAITWFTPVSYTHLDVYKRQVLSGADYHFTETLLETH